MLFANEGLPSVTGRHSAATEELIRLPRNCLPSVNLPLWGSFTHPKEPAFVPKVQVHFADFPYPLYSRTRGINLGDLLRTSVRSPFNYIKFLRVSSNLHNTPGTTDTVTLLCYSHHPVSVWYLLEDEVLALTRKENPPWICRDFVLVNNGFTTLRCKRRFRNINLVPFRPRGFIIRK